VKFGIFDHLDRGRRTVADLYASRLETIEQFDEAGFFAYHLAEHHSTPLGMAPSPSVFLAAVAQRTTRLRFGPMVYLLPLYHPLRLAEEIAMLDHLSGGRLEIGIGRGRSPIELRLYGRDAANAQAVFEEALAVIQLAFSQEYVTFQGEHFAFDRVPMELRPLQQPHPPLWYGVGSPESAAYCGERGFHGVTLARPALAAEIVQRFFRAASAAGRARPNVGIARFVVVGESDREAQALANRAYPVWHESFFELFHRYGQRPVSSWSDSFDEMAANGLAFAGSPASVRAAIQAQLDETGVNYFVGQFVFGDLDTQESRNSIGLFAREVMPALQGREEGRATIGT
jgi:alkanesulfonate monooxygenase SsuD/methylene tetrahydromethanopterin reductase-like flavin-dependent oxidoreductase (luciferase family)